MRKSADRKDLLRKPPESTGRTRARTGSSGPHHLHVTDTPRRGTVSALWVRNMDALNVLRLNIESLLKQDRIQQKSLADALGHHKSWINKFLKGTRPQLSLVDLPVIANFFGVEVHQLFTPGATAITDRRQGAERRQAARQGRQTSVSAAAADLRGKTVEQRRGERRIARR